MNRPESSKLFRQISQSPPPNDVPKNHNHSNIASACYLPTRRDVPHRASSSRRRSAHLEDVEDTSTDEDGETTEDSTDNRIDHKPKPGKLDLRQFDNISSAIGKLNITASTSASPMPAACPLTTSSANHPTKHVNKSIASSHDRSDSGPQSAVSSRRRGNNLRQNHGRAVAPPKLPMDLLYNPIHRSGNVSSSHSRRIYHRDDENAIDLSQSPFAQRVLKHSKNHKVSELHSPYASDVELHLPSAVRLQDFYKADQNDNTSFPRYSSTETCDLINSRGETIRQLNEILAKKPPGPLGPSRPRVERDLSNDPSTDDTRQTSGLKKDEKDNKKDGKKLRSDEKLEKRRLKEEERQRRQEEEKLRRQEKKLASKKSKTALKANSTGEDGIPLFIKRCIEFIESEGLDAEGLYRVPGNRAHVDAFVNKFKENPGMSIVESDTPVNAVATALKDFLSKKWDPIIPSNLMQELTELKYIPEKEQRIEAMKELTRKLPLANHNLLKYVFSHFVKVSLNNMSNSMDSKNLAICWWPTLLPLNFDDMIMFEQMRPHLEESIQTMIDQYDYIFGEDQQLSK